MDIRRKADIVLTFLLQTDWPKMVRRLVWVVRRQWLLSVRWVRRSWWRVRHMRRRDWQLAARRMGERARRIDVRKPTHAVAIGLIVAGIVAPIMSWMGDNERYRLDGAEAAVVTKVAPHLKDKLAYEQPQQQTVFNAGGEQAVAQEAKDVLTTRVGGAEKKATQLYTATFPNDASSGVVVNDNVNKVPVTFKPLFGTMGGRDVGGHVVYPLKDKDGQVVYTPKANAMKEDIVLNSSPGDTYEFQYQLDMPKFVQARVDQDGSIGFYTGDPVLFGNIQFGSDSDKTEIDKARDNAKKTYEMFKVPAPVIIQGSNAKGTAGGRFSLDGNVLTLRVSGMDSAAYPLSVDPTFYLTSTADFLLGSSDDNVDLSVANQVGRGALDGGQLASWSQNACSGTNVNLTGTNFSFGLTAYNGFIYTLGGGNTGSNAVTYADVNLTSGVLGCNTPTAGGNSFTATNSFNTARVGPQAFGYNGYLYVLGGEQGSTPFTTFSDDQYGQLTSTGTVAANTNGCGTAFCNNSHTMNTARAYFASALYQGVIYVFGGSTNDNPIQTTLTNTVEYARINGDGSIGTWNYTTNLTSARNRFSAAAYNGYVYVAGGEVAGGTPATDTVTNLLQYAPINSDGTLGSWLSTTSFPSARRDFGFATERGHMYVYGGCPNNITTACTSTGALLADTQYAVINADGTVGQWQQTQNTAIKRGAADSMATTFYNGHLYSAGGCSKEAAASNNCNNGSRSNIVLLTNVNSTGSFDGLSAQASTPYNPQASSVARFGGQAVSLNGYVYYIGGSSTTGGTAYSAVVSYAQINTDGSLGAWSTTGSLPASVGTDTAGRTGFGLAAVGTKLYVVGGIEIVTTGGARNYLTSVISAYQQSNGTLNATNPNCATATWCPETSLPAADADMTVVVWNNYIYAIGGRDSTTTTKNTTYSATIGATGTLSSWGSTNTITAVWGQAGAIYGNYIYLLGGNTSATGTASLATTVQIGTINTSSGAVTWTTTTALGTATMWGRALIHNDFIYFYGGAIAAGVVQTAISWAQITPSTGAIGTWSTSNIGAQSFNGTNGLGFARGGEAGVDVDGYNYLIGGCHATESLTLPDTCTTIVTATSTTETEVYQPNDGGTGQTGAWASASITALPTAKADAAALAYNGYLYSIGGCTAYSSGCSTYSTEIKYAAINSDGTVGAWSPTTYQLGTGTDLLQAAAYNGYMYILGGQQASTGAVQTVLYGAIGSTGDIASMTSASSMGTARRNFGAAITNGYIYAVGGENASGLKQSGTEYAAINADGTLGTWGSSTALPNDNQGAFSARAGLSVVTYSGYIYAIGGVDSNGNTLQDIQYAQLNSSTGAIGSWANTIMLPLKSISRQVFAANGYMYFLGNETTSTQISYAPISSNGVLGLLSDQPNAMTAAHAHGSVAYYNGMFYDMGGCTITGAACSSAPITTNERGGQLAISRAAHYSKLWQTQGVDTAPSEISLNGTLQGQGSAIASIMRTSSSFDPTLGVAQVFNPVIFNNFYRIFAYNSSGVNVGVANTYALEIKLDDTQEGTFPDINTSQTAVSDITLYYHANPSRRLRHGASFSNVGCNINPANGCILDTAP